MLVANMNFDRDSTSQALNVAVIIVTYNSGRVLKRCIDSIMKQSRRPDTVIVVDNCSSDTSYLDFLNEIPNCQLVKLPRNEGFCSGNNRGFAIATGYEHILFLNPDAFLAKRFVEEAAAIMDDPVNSRVGALGGTLLGFDVAADRSTEKLDSTGIFQTWYGKWYDRGQGAAHSTNDRESVSLESVPALCGALMFCRRRALAEVTIRGTEIFDSTFFMYKEDIDLSLRLRRSGWIVAYCAYLHCHHGRGWSGRNAMAPFSKYLSARNELRLCLRNHARGFAYSGIKFLYVCLFETGIGPALRYARLRFRN
jgi:N-acetylglucosaminyl-diphospho-decaprenol L-rhamnosyltransferase